MARHEPNLINPPTNGHFLVDRNSQCGFGLSPTAVPDEVLQFFQDERPWGTDQNLRQVYVRNFHRIRDTETINRRSKIFSITPIPHSLKPLPMCLKISSDVKPMLSRSICHFLLFYNTERLVSSDTVTPVTKFPTSHSKPTRS